MQFKNYQELAQRIAEMTPEQQQKPVMTFDHNTGELNEVGTLHLATDLCEPAPENQYVID